MKKIKHIAMLGFIALTAIVSSCEETNDWSSDSQYNRLFRSSSLAVSPSTFTAEVIWTNTPNTDYYIIELNKEPFADDEFQEGSKIYGEDKSITSSPCTIGGLEELMTYNIRIRSCSATATPSKWTYLKDATFTTKSEQILGTEAVSNVTSKSATITWEAGLEVTHFTTEANGNKERREITSEEKAAGKVILTDLQSATNYSVSIYNAEKLRGNCKFETTEDYPEGYSVVALQEGDDISTTLDGKSGNIVLSFPANTTFERTEKLTIPSTISSIIFWGAAGGEQAKYKIKEITANEGTTSIKFYNLDIYNTSNGGDYMLNQDAMANLTTFAIDKCLVHDSRGVIRVQGSGKGCTIENVEFTNTNFYNIGSYGLLSMKDMAVKMKNLNVSKCTFNSVTSGPTFTVHTDNLAINIDQSTFYNCATTSGKHIIDVNKLDNNTIIFSNCLFAKCGSSDAKNKLCSVKANVKETENVVFTSDCVWHSEGAAMGTVYEATSASLFEDPENGNFKIKDPLFQNRAGDPRWFTE